MPIKNNSEIFNLVTMLLAEKRTSLAVLRTGIAIFTLPLSVFTILIATSKYYEISNSLHFVLPLIIICIILIMLGVYLILRSFRKIKDADNKIQKIRLREEFLKDKII